MLRDGVNVGTTIIVSNIPVAQLIVPGLALNGRAFSPHQDGYHRLFVEIAHKLNNIENAWTYI